MSLPHYAVCSIFAKNYVGYARTLFQSFRQYHPELRCFGLVVDEWQGLLDPANEPFEIVSLGDLQIPELEKLKFKYDITELATAAKPFLLDRILRDQGIDRLLYLDPDIMVTDSLTRLFDRLDAADFLVTPHLDTDFPDDGKMPDDKAIMTSGIYNLGFFGVRSSANGLAMLDWWKHKLATKCVMEHASGYFVDQRFIDLAKGLFPHFEIIREPGYNAAYWNLHSRTISKAGDQWLCNGTPLSFFHFSGYNTKRPTTISRHCTRFSWEDRPDIQPLFQEYHAKILANGHETASPWPYSYGSYATGEPIKLADRRFYRQLAHAEARLPEPFQSHAALTKLKRVVEAELNPFSFIRTTRSYLGSLKRGMMA